MRHVISPGNLARAPGYDLVPALRRDQQKSETTSRTAHYSAIITTLVSYTFTNYKSYLFTRATDNIVRKLLLLQAKLLQGLFGSSFFGQGPARGITRSHYLAVD
jgi:hypothetical protein